MTDKVQPLESLSKKPEEPKIIVNLRRIKRKIMIMSGKGGVGKSTVAANLAAGLALRGYRVGLLDCDIHGPTIPTIFGLESQTPDVNEEGILPIQVLPNLSLMSVGFLLGDQDSPIIWRGPAKMGAIKQFLEEVNWGALDFLIIDLPPGTGDEPLSVAQLIPECDGSVLVTTPQDVALISVRKSIKFSEKLKVPVIGLVDNMHGLICPHCGKPIEVFGSGGVEKASKDFNIPVLARLPIEPKVAEMEDKGTVVQYLLEHSTEWQKNFEAVVTAVEKILVEKK
ncbi:MAG: Mrp/NBP35 family ATP-binding protein [Methanosarcina sp.]|jgi:ATP-binding protein involved in chromosome partitioning|nr:Mrp/NBP35 family ATP-binding protein [Methanosarcina sp.]MDD3315904.1 Mrp/NBP35 family ATP-binding protein [Methanosarcina sp.]MDD4305262.1 Mrp/NBP35 family ATP-binding protein [Methanosarcina sp.]MDD4620758.1 Mrp/NBP35 family ATP-binding protein [Methanosarcina sp.]